MFLHQAQFSGEVQSHLQWGVYYGAEISRVGCGGVDGEGLFTCGEGFGV